MCPQIQELTMVSSVGKNFANVYVSTRDTLTELGAGKYNCYAIQFAGDEKAEAKISFEIGDSDSVVGMLGEIRDRLDRL